MSQLFAGFGVPAGGPPPLLLGGTWHLLLWALLEVGSAASLAANVAVAQPTPVGQVIRRLAVAEQ